MCVIIELEYCFHYLVSEVKSIDRKHSSVLLPEAEPEDDVLYSSYSTSECKVQSG